MGWLVVTCAKDLPQKRTTFSRQTAQVIEHLSPHRTAVTTDWWHRRHSHHQQLCCRWWCQSATLACGSSGAWFFFISACCGDGTFISGEPWSDCCWLALPVSQTSDLGVSLWCWLPPFISCVWRWPTVTMSRWRSLMMRPGRWMSLTFCCLWIGRRGGGGAWWEGGRRFGRGVGRHLAAGTCLPSAPCWMGVEDWWNSEFDIRGWPRMKVYRISFSHDTCILAENWDRKCITLIIFGK